MIIFDPNGNFQNVSFLFSASEVYQFDARTDWIVQFCIYCPSLHLSLYEASQLYLGKLMLFISCHSVYLSIYKAKQLYSGKQMANIKLSQLILLSF